MSDWQLTTPVAFCIFNRPDTTAKVFEMIRQVKPPKLLVIADAPRPNKPEDIEKYTATRAIIDCVDWDCEVIKNYAESNLGIGLRLSTGITWVFEQVEEAIFLEDDCLPHPTWFRFCEELLQKYRHNPSVMSICGTKINDSNMFNFLLNPKNRGDSYYFSHYFNPWGWASWRRAWQYYDFEMKGYPELLKQGWLEQVFPDKKEAEFWKERFIEVLSQFHTWDYQWEFAIWGQNSLSITPHVNLINNSGFGNEATNTSDPFGIGLNIPVRAMKFPLKHPPSVVRNQRADWLTKREILGADSESITYRLNRKLRKIVRQILS